MLSEYKKILMDSEKAKERVRWAINYSASEHGLTNEKLAKIIGCSTSTINSYRRKVTLPGLEFFVVFLYEYGFNLDWFVYGRGEPFPGARAKYPEVCGPEYPAAASATIGMGVRADAVVIRGNQTTDAPAPAMEFSIAEDLTLAAAVLESGGHFATALHMNIRSFHKGIAAEALIHKCEEDLRAQGEAIRKLQARLDEMEGESRKLSQENKKLSEEIRELKGKGGGSEPFALGADVAARTGTDDQTA